MKQVLLFGGTFDPPHIGHLTMAQLAVEQTKADEVWFLPAPLPPHKLGESHLPYSLRVDMVKALVHGYNKLSVSTIETFLHGPSYTVDTVMECQRRYTDVEFRFLLGSDSLADLPTWHRASELTRLIPFVAADRSSHLFEQTVRETRQRLQDLRVQVIEMPLLDVSSSWLRARLNAGEPVCGLVPEGVLKIWHDHFSGRL